MRHRLQVFTVLGLALALASCSAVRQVRPLARGEQAVNVSLGGPMTQYVGDAYLPLPFLSVGYNYGLIEKMDIEAGIHLTHTLFSNPTVDLALNWRPWTAQRWRPSLIVSPAAYLTTDFKTAFLFHPALSLTGAWKAGEHVYPYLGMHNMWELADERQDGAAEEHHWLIAPYLGVSLVCGRWQYQVECKVYTPNLDNEYGRAVQNLGFGDYGILGFYLGIGRTFGGGK